MGNWALRKKLFAAFGVIVALVAVVGGTTYFGIGEVERLQAQQRAYQEVAMNVERLYATLLMARRHEKDFFARHGDEKYLKLHAERGQEFAAIEKKVKDLLGNQDPELLQQLNAAVKGYADYQATFSDAAAAFLRRGSQDTGLQGEFRDAAHAVEEQAKHRDDQKLTILLLQMRRAEKDFLLRDDPSYKEKLHGYAEDARRYLAPLAASDPEVSRTLELLDTYVRKFDAAFDAELKVSTYLNDLHDDTESIEKVLSEFEEMAVQHMDGVNVENDKIRQTTELIVAIVFVVTIALALLVARIIASQISSGVSQLIDGTQRIGNGDLRTKVQVATRDEIGELGSSLNAMSDSLRKMASNIGDATGSMNDVVRELQATVAEQGAAMQQQASSVSETVATVDEIARSAEQVSETANRVLDTASSSMETSKSGVNAIQQSIEGMNDVREQVQNIARTILDLSEKTQQIGSIIATVDDFAEQSSLLALNASIEAARAGEDGKAFSVVAAEVKNLAEQSQQATEKVRSILSDIQRTTHTAVMVTEEGSKRVERGVELVGSAGEIISTLTRSIAQSADSAKQIAAAARQQNNGIEQISVAIAGIDQFARQNLTAIKQTETTSQTLATVADQLRISAAQYQL